MLEIVYHNIMVAIRRNYAYCCDIPVISCNNIINTISKIFNR